MYTVTVRLLYTVTVRLLPGSQAYVVAVAWPVQPGQSCALGIGDRPAGVLVGQLSIEYGCISAASWRHDSSL